MPNRPPSHPPRRGTRAALVLTVLTALAIPPACGGGNGNDEVLHSLLPLRGQVVTDQAAILALDKYWRAVPDQGWSLAGAASVLCWVDHAPETGLGILLHPLPETARCHFRINWDGEPLGDGEPRTLSAEGETLRIPADRLTPGPHTLELRRVPTLDAPADAKRGYLGFQRVAHVVDGTTVEIPVDQQARNKYLSHFLQFGLTGNRNQKAEGCMFVGPRSSTLTLELARDAQAEFYVENYSGEAATFSATLDGTDYYVEVPAKQTRPLTFPITGGRHSLTLAVDGLSRGYYFWGAPYLQEDDLDLPGPIVLLSLDTTRRDALSMYGENPDTPNLQELADTATVYDNAWTTGPWTLPTHASMFTGLYPARHGAGVRRDHLRRDLDTVAEQLQENGYYTVGVVGGSVAGSHRGFGQGFYRYRDPRGGESEATVLTNPVLGFLAKNHARPLFLFMNYFDPHALYRPPTKWATRYGVPELRQKLGKMEHWAEMSRGDHKAWGRIKMGRAEPVEAGIEFIKAAYRAEVAFMDEQIGRLFDALRQRGLFDDALIIICSDHGELLGENGLFSHSFRLDPELVWMPLIVKWPGQKEGRRVQHLASQVDLFATILEHALGEAPRSEGLSLAPDNESTLAGRSTVFAEEHIRSFHRNIKRMFIGNDVYGVHRIGEREVVWEDGLEFARQQGLQWQTGTSPKDHAERWKELRTWASLRAPSADEDIERGMSAEQEALLRELGYVK